MTGRVLIVDDHELVAESLALALRAEGLTVLRSDGRSSEAIRAAVTEHEPDVVLLDLDLGEGLRGEEMVPWLRAQDVRVLVVTGTVDEFAVAAAVATGAAGFVRKSAPFPELVDRVLAVTRGERLLTDAERARLVAAYDSERVERADVRRRVDRLTPREREVLRHLVSGQRAEDVAQELFVSIATVRSQIRSILTKLEVSSQLSAVALAHQVRLERADRA